MKELLILILGCIVLFILCYIIAIWTMNRRARKERQEYADRLTSWTKFKQEYKKVIED